MHLKIPPMIMMALFALLMWLVARQYPRFLVMFEYKDPLAGLFMVAGVLLAGAGVRTFFKAKTTINPTTPGAVSALVTGGVYRYSRNPMYVGFTLVLVGWGMYLANLAALIVLPPVYVAYIDRFQILPEEKVLERLFGEEFESYRKNVRRWL